MYEPTVAATATALTDPRAFERLVLEAAARGPTMVDEATGAVWVLRHGDVERLLHEPALHGVGLGLFDAMGIGAGPLREWYGALMFTNDGPAHDRLRRLVSKAFTPRAVEQLRALAAMRVADALLPLRRAGGGDLRAALGEVPMQVMCALLGVPALAVPEFIAWVDALSPVFGLMEPAQILAAEEAIVELLAYVGMLVEHRSNAPAGDLMSALVAAEHDGDRLTRDETVRMVSNLLVGGHDTTASQIGCSLSTLLEHPEGLATVRSEPRTLAAVVSETIRFRPSIVSAPRTASAPLEVCGVERPAGTPIVCAFLSANRDPAVWREPEVFVPHRFDEPAAPRLLSFGGGPHYCLGAALARVTLEESVRGVAALAPRLAVDVDRLEWATVLGRSPVSLPVTL